MSSAQFQFGYWPDPTDFSVCGVTVRTLSDHAAAVARVRGSAGVHDGWIFSPPRRHQDFLTGQTRDLPVPGRVFGLPKTHQLEVDASHPNGLGRFVVWCLGFFIGMRLTETDMGFLDATPIDTGELCDFICTTRELPRALEPTIDFYLWHGRGAVTETLLAAIHALWLSEGPHLLRFEQYHYAYVAFDALWYVMSRTAPAPPPYTPHAKRIENLAKQLGIQVPLWPALIKERNDSIHQGLFYGQPLGFSTDTGESGNTVLEMQAFICRAIVKLLGIPAASYVGSPCTSRQRYGLF